MSVALRRRRRRDRPFRTPPPRSLPDGPLGCVRASNDVAAGARRCYAPPARHATTVEIKVSIPTTVLDRLSEMSPSVTPAAGRSSSPPRPASRLRSSAVRPRDPWSDDTPPPPPPPGVEEWRLMQEPGWGWVGCTDRRQGRSGRGIGTQETSTRAPPTTGPGVSRVHQATGSGMTALAGDRPATVVPSGAIGARSGIRPG